jgi:hypothetical protein
MLLTLRTGPADYGHFNIVMLLCSTLNFLSRASNVVPLEIRIKEDCLN